MSTSINLVNGLPPTQIFVRVKIECVVFLSQGQVSSLCCMLFMRLWCYAFDLSFFTWSEFEISSDYVSWLLLFYHMNFSSAFITSNAGYYTSITWFWAANLKRRICSFLILSTVMLQISLYYSCISMQYYIIACVLQRGTFCFLNAIAHWKCILASNWISSYSVTKWNMILFNKL